MTARRRAGDTRQALSRGFAMPTARQTPAVEPVGEEPAEPAPTVLPAAATPAKPAEIKSKYTALLDAGTAADFDDLALKARRTLGRKVDKSEIVRALIRLAADDASLRDQVIGEVGRQ